MSKDACGFDFPNKASAARYNHSLHDASFGGVSPVHVSNVFCKCTRLKIVHSSTEVAIKYTQTQVHKYMHN